VGFFYLLFFLLGHIPGVIWFEGLRFGFSGGWVMDIGTGFWIVIVLFREVIYRQTIMT
jgi:hypothetical protein